MFLHRALLEWNTAEMSKAYMSSILLVNQNVPFFEETFGMLDYDWMLKVTENRTCTHTEPCVVRYVSGNNLSLDPEYRKKDFYMAMLKIDGNLKAMRRLCGSRARYYYKIGSFKISRFYFLQSEFNIKTVLYYITSFLPIRNYVNKKFRVFG